MNFTEIDVIREARSRQGVFWQSMSPLAIIAAGRDTFRKPHRAERIKAMDNFKYEGGTHRFPKTLSPSHGNHRHMTYRIIEQTPSLADYMRLRDAGNLTPFSEDAGRKGLAGSWFCICVVHDGRKIGMGRIISDGGCFFQIVDIVVDPDHRGQGLGKEIMGALVARLNSHAPKSAYVSLMADVPADKLYAQFGFKPTAPRSIGMALTLK